VTLSNGVIESFTQPIHSKLLIHSGSTRVKYYFIVGEKQYV